MGCVVAVAAWNPVTYAFTPDVTPVTVTGFVASKY